MKKFVLLVALICSFLVIDVYAIAANMYGNYVIDDGNVLTDSTSDYISSYSSKLLDKAGVEYRVVVLYDTLDVSLEEYTDYLYDSFNIAGDGILLLVSYRDRMIRVKVGGELADSITSEVIDEYIGSYFMPFLKNDKWDEGIKNGYSSFYKLICDIYKVDSSDVVVYNDVDFVSKYKEILFLIVVWLNTTISYVMCKYFINVYKKNYKLGLFDSILFGLVLFVNIMLLVFTFSIDFFYSIFIFLLELVAIYSNITSERLDGIRKRHGSINKTDKKKKDICYNGSQGGKNEKK